MLILGAGGVLAAALVVWALTRTVEPTSVMDTSTVAGYSSTASTTPAPAETPAGTATTATAPPRTRPQGDPSSVQRIAIEDLRAMMNRNEVTIIDVRDANSFKTRHIPGAINIPFASVETMLDQIPKDKAIVTYCT